MASSIFRGTLQLILHGSDLPSTGDQIYEKETDDDLLVPVAGDKTTHEKRNPGPRSKDIYRQRNKAEERNVTASYHAVPKLGAASLPTGGQTLLWVIGIGAESEENHERRQNTDPIAEDLAAAGLSALAILLQASIKVIDPRLIRAKGEDKCHHQTDYELAVGLFLRVEGLKTYRDPPNVGKGRSGATPFVQLLQLDAGLFPIFDVQLHPLLKQNSGIVPHILDAVGDLLPPFPQNQLCRVLIHSASERRGKIPCKVRRVKGLVLTQLHGKMDAAIRNAFCQIQLRSDPVDYLQPVHIHRGGEGILRLVSPGTAVYARDRHEMVLRRGAFFDLIYLGMGGGIQRNTGLSRRVELTVQFFQLLSDGLLIRIFPDTVVVVIITPDAPDLACLLTEMVGHILHTALSQYLRLELEIQEALLLAVLVIIHEGKSILHFLLIIRYAAKNGSNKDIQPFSGRVDKDHGEKFPQQDLRMGLIAPIRYDELDFRRGFWHTVTPCLLLKSHFRQQRI